ncbi:MAG: competence/damage-inducible protein A [Clostridia bacterium]|nr:competence/damage-inducible protein A [Clostridia bacterium]
MRTEILSVGTELLMGQIANTDAQYISARLPETGAGVFFHTVVGDNPSRLRECLDIALGRSDVVITTGGLGPTQDDLTKQVIADHFGLKLIDDAGSRRRIEEFFKRRGQIPTDNNYRQSLIPEGARIIPNENGTAPGCMIFGTGAFSGKTVIMLPGPPKELKPMFDRYVMEYFAGRSGMALKSRFVRICGTGESAVETKLMALIDGQTNPTFATYAKDGLVTVRVTAGAKDEKEADELVESGVNQIINILGDDVYSVDNEEPEEALIRLLKANSLTVSAAESLTGGMISSKLTSVPGASSVFMGGVVSYTDAVKHGVLGVKQETLTKFTAVSSETCREMADGVKRLIGTDISIAVTGYAGPAVADEPVGLVFIGVAAGGLTYVKECHFSGSRDRIRTLTAVNAIDFTRRIVNELTAALGCGESEGDNA